MKSTRQLLFLSLVCGLGCFLPGCASIGPPVPPSLELPRPPGDLRAVRKGEHVYLFWTVPTQTIDRQNVRHLGRTDICRSLEPAFTECGTPAGSITPDTPPMLRRQHANLKLQANYTDTIPADLQQQNPTQTITYAVDVLNASGRGAGLSNQVHVPLAPTLPLPQISKRKSPPVACCSPGAALSHQSRFPISNTDTGSTGARRGRDPISDSGMWIVRQLVLKTAPLSGRRPTNIGLLF